MKKYMNEDGTPFSKEQFIEKIKTDKEFSDKFGNLGPIYGKQWRDWRKPHWTESELSIASGGVQGGSSYTPIQIDQIQNLINDLKTNPDSRRLMVSAWNVGELDQMVLPPCHYGFQMYTRKLTLAERIKTAKASYPKFNSADFGHADGISEEEFQHHQLDEKYPGVPTRAISLMWSQRSCDVFLGAPFNIASYGLLLSIIAKEVDMVPDQLVGNLGDTHLYLNHLDQAREQMKRKPFELPTLKIEGEVKWSEGDCLPTYSVGDLKLENYQSHPAIKAPLSN